jgi:hypothetical protein
VSIHCCLLDAFGSGYPSPRVRSLSTNRRHPGGNTGFSNTKSDASLMAGEGVAADQHRGNTRVQHVTQEHHGVGTMSPPRNR